MVFSGFEEDMVGNHHSGTSNVALQFYSIFMRINCDLRLGEALLDR